MKSLFFILVCLLLLNCDKDDCLKIRNKYTGNGQYFFELNDSGVFNNSGNSTDEDPNPTAIVSQDTYNKYQVGDKFCRK